jgi:thiol-disulfide isomerase/thioredoxin
MRTGTVCSGRAHLVARIQGDHDEILAKVLWRRRCRGWAGARRFAVGPGRQIRSVLDRSLQGGAGRWRSDPGRIHADWCPTCKAQGPILDKLTADPKFKDLKVFRVDFDTMKPVVKQFGAQMQSTLIVFKGSAEKGRSVGDTKQSSIAALLDKGL